MSTKPKLTLEQIVVEAAKAGARVTVELIPIQYVSRAIKLFGLAQQEHHYLYFELAFTHATDWMCWLVDKSKKAKKGEPASEEGFAVLARGQSTDANRACEDVVRKLEQLGYK